MLAVQYPPWQTSRSLIFILLLLSQYDTFSGDLLVMPAMKHEGWKWPRCWNIVEQDVGASYCEGGWLRHLEPSTNERSAADEIDEDRHLCVVEQAVC